MNTHGLVITLFFLILLSAFFSAAETAMMAVNRYRVRYLARQKNRAAIRTQKLLEHPDRLLGIVLIGNNTANVSASAVATLLAVQHFGNLGVALVTGLLTFVLLIFSELVPKTLAAVYPQRLAFFTSFPLTILTRLLYPIIWVTSGITNGLLKLCGIRIPKHVLEHLTLEELRTLLHEAGGRIPPSHQDMLLRMVDLGDICVEDVMVPRTAIEGIDLSLPWTEILTQLQHSQHTRLPVYNEDINQAQGFFNIRPIQALLAKGEFTQEKLLSSLSEMYFIPEGTPLNAQLLNFRKQNLRIALLVDEYGDVIGLITLEDIIEEIVGDLAWEGAPLKRAVQHQVDGSYLIDGSISIRELNRMMGWKLDLRGPKTLSGLITDYLETMPQVGIAVRIAGVPMEIIEVRGKTIKMVKAIPSTQKK